MMKKIYSVFMLVIACLLMSSCSKKNDNQGLISVYLEGSSNNQAIEIYNFSDESMNLNDYSICIYKIGTTDDKPTYTVKLNGILESKKCFVVCNDKATKELIDKSDLKSPDLIFGGLEAVALKHYDKVVDCIGSIGLRNTHKDYTLVRKLDMLEVTPTFDLYNYIIYGTDNFNYLGEFTASISSEEYLQGPKITSDLLNKAFVSSTNSKLGAGGAVEVKLCKNVDGDTSWFTFPEFLSIEDFVASNNIEYHNGEHCCKVRYMSIDTQETMQNMIEEFGWPAKLKTADLQNKADHIYVQSIDNYSLAGNYGRLLGYVYVQNGNDSTMVNFEIIKSGLSDAAVVRDNEMTYKDAMIYGYFVNADLYARKNNLGLYGEKDPYWDYEKNKSIFAK